MVIEVLEKTLPRVKVDPTTLRDTMATAAPTPPEAAAARTVWIPSTRRLYGLLSACLKHDEPVLLVGETGTGKTTVCELYAQAIGVRLHAINCHQHTETADFIGGLRPARGRKFKLAAVEMRVKELEGKAGATPREGEDASGSANSRAAEPSADELRARVDRLADLSANSEMSAEISAEIDGVRGMLCEAEALFSWYDGPLLTAMRNGELLLIDEISLADDAVRPAHPSRACSFCCCCGRCWCRGAGARAFEFGARPRADSGPAGALVRNRGGACGGRISSDGDDEPGRRFREEGALSRAAQPIHRGVGACR